VTFPFVKSDAFFSGSLQYSFQSRVLFFKRRSKNEKIIDGDNKSV